MRIDVTVWGNEEASKKADIKEDRDNVIRRTRIVHSISGGNVSDYKIVEALLQNVKEF